LRWYRPADLLLADEDNIREVMRSPKTQRAENLMLGVAD